MALVFNQNQSSFVAFAAIFTALVTAFDVIPTTIIPGFYSGIWDSWIFLLSPLVGVLLGPVIGVYSVGLGSILGHFLYPRDPTELLFMWGAPLGATIAGLVYQKRWRPVLVIYTFLLASYFLTPVTWMLPLIGIWDTLVGFGVVVLFSIVAGTNLWPAKGNTSELLRLIFCAIIGLEADILLRIFILVPCQTYWTIFQWTPEILQIIWLSAGIVTAIKVTLATILTVTIGMSLLQVLPNLKIHFQQEPES